jgi:hypothetical protein
MVNDIDVTSYAYGWYDVGAPVHEARTSSY